MDKLTAFIRSWLSEPNGTVSNTRICVALIVFFALGWITALVARVRGPIGVADLVTIFPPIGMFVTATAGTLYGVNKVTNMFGTNSDRKDSPSDGGK